MWYAGLHENTENKHIHLSFFEKEPMYFANGGNLKYHTGKLPKNVLIDARYIFEKALTNPTAQLLKDRKDLYDKYDAYLDKGIIGRKAKRILLELYNRIPRDGRTGYSTENMENVRKNVDDVTEYFLKRNKNLSDIYVMFKKDCIEFLKWKDERFFEKESAYLKDMKRRLGNLTISTAISLGHIHDELEKVKLKMVNYKAYKKFLRKREWEKILYLWEQTNYEIQKEIDFFKAFHEKLEYFSRQQEYEVFNSKNNRDFEM